MDLTDTVVATSTPAGRSLRAIVRLSGPRAVPIASAVFEPVRPLDRLPSYSSTDGFVVLAADGIRCPAAAYVMLAPRSYTREDVVELHTFGSPPLLAALTDALVRAGARPAEPGEFTRRAFLNGRIDLTQAEAVQSVIHARSDAELRVSQSQLGGALREAVESLRSGLVALLAEIEASIDFAEEDVPLIAPGDAAARIGDIRGEVESLAGAEPPSPPKDGVAAAICGLANAGKSSLLNALAGQPRALVTPVAGTTRDTVEHAIEACGIAFRLVDTAGIRRTARRIEREAIERATRAAESAALVLLVIDSARRFDARVRSLWERLTSRPDVPVIAVLNKCDLECRVSLADEGLLAQRSRIVRVSALRGDGLDDLRAEMARAVSSGSVDRSAHGFWLGARHRAALRRAAAALDRAQSATAPPLGVEFAAADLREALDALGDMVGATTADDVLDVIFSRFCIGK